MKKCKGILFLVLIVFVMITGCEKKDDTNVTTTEKTTEKQTETVDRYKFDYDHIYDGISRIAVTFYEDSTSQIGLSWYTPAIKEFGNDVEIIEKASETEVKFKCVIESGDAKYDEESIYHQALIEGLLPDTEYFFRIGDKKKNKWSDYGTFKTASVDADEFTFIALTDTQNAHLADAYYAAETIRMATLTAKNSAFIMHSGDFVDNGNDEKLWLGQMNAAKEVLMNNIIVPAVGNHEEEDHAFWQHFKLPHTNGHKTTGVYYSFDYGNAHFVVLDTNKVNDDETSYIDDEQLEWLDNDLKTAREKGAKWIIVNIHKGMFTVGEHADNEKFKGEGGARVRVCKVLEKYNVDLVIQGHDHCPSVTKPIVQSEVSENGIVYMNTGSAGPKAYGVEEVLDDDYLKLFDYIADSDREDDTYQNFAKIEVTNDKIKVTMYEMNLLAVENNMYIIHEFEIKD